MSRFPLDLTRRTLMKTGAALGAARILGPFAGSSLAQEAPRSGGTLVHGIEADMPWMDPHIVWGGSNKRVVWAVFEGLVNRDRSAPGREPPLIGELATSWQISEDHKLYTFELRQGVKFQDGTPFNSEAVAFNFRRIIDPGFKYYFSKAKPLQSSTLQYLKEVKVTGEHTVQLVLSQPWQPFLDQLTVDYTSGLPLMISPAAVEKWGNDEVNLHAVGTGPFKVTEYNPGVKTVLERNPDYWKEPLPHLDKLVFVVMAEPSTRVTALQSGEVNLITSLPPDSIRSLEQEGFNVVIPEMMNLNWFYSINLQNELMKDLRVRQAMNYAIDRERLTKELLRGTCDPYWTMDVPTSPVFDPSERPYLYDPDKAKHLLKEAGHANGLKIKAQIPTGGSYEIVPVPITEWVQRDFAAVGIDLEIQTYDWVTYISYWIKGMTPDVALNQMSWLGGYNAWWAADVFKSDGFGNTGHIKDADLDAIFVEFAKTFEPEKSKTLASSIFKRVSGQAYFIPITGDKNAYAATQDVKGFVPVPDPVIAMWTYWLQG